MSNNQDSHKSDVESQTMDGYSTKKLQQMAPDFKAANFHAEGGPPQHLRLGGFREVFERYPSRLDEIVCYFNAEAQNDCRHDVMHGTIECDVPPSVFRSSSTEDTLYVKVRIADFESPPLAVKYTVGAFSDRNMLMNTEEDPANEKGQKVGMHEQWLRLLSREKQRNSERHGYSLLHQCIAECIGTMFIVVFGVGIVCSVVTTGSDLGLYQIASVWGLGIMIAILVSVSVSGAHLNPAVSLAMSIFRPRDFPLHKLLPFWLAQYLGGVLGGAFNLMIFSPLFSQLESANNIIRSEPSGIRTAMAFGEYFPNPAFNIPKDTISAGSAMVVEAWGTGILMFVILAVTDPRQKVIRNKEMIPFYIGFTVAVLMSLYTPITQGGFNPARDFGPRLVAAMAGWGKNAIPGPRNGFWLYIIGPKIGAMVGAFAYGFFINPGLTDN